MSLKQIDSPEVKPTLIHHFLTFMLFSGRRVVALLKKSNSPWFLCLRVFQLHTREESYLQWHLQWLPLRAYASRHCQNTLPKMIPEGNFWPKDIRIGVAAQELREENGVNWQQCASLLNALCCHDGTQGGRGKILPRWIVGKSFKSLLVSFTHVNILAFLNLFFPTFSSLLLEKQTTKPTPAGDSVSQLHSCCRSTFPARRSWAQTWAPTSIMDITTPLTCINRSGSCRFEADSVSEDNCNAIVWAAWDSSDQAWITADLGKSTKCLSALEKHSQRGAAKVQTLHRSGKYIWASTAKRSTRGTVDLWHFQEDSESVN